MTQGDSTRSKPTIGVIVPTLDCASLLRGHLDSMAEWLDLADQIVVVDSYSGDGTWQLLQSGLKGPKTSFHQLPRGLYQAWNYGINQLTTDFVYFSTIGDSISRAGLNRLRILATSLDADVVISPPEFIEEDGSRSESSPHWPIHELIQTQGIAEPAVIDNWILLLLSLENPVDAVLGSSASNLYRTSMLRAKPFPTGYGTVGDGAWGLANIFDYRLAVTPEHFSFFRKHQKAYGTATYHVDRLNRMLFDLLLARFGRLVAKDSGLRRCADELGCTGLAKLVDRRMVWQTRLEEARRSPVPWTINPFAWHSRSRRNYYRKKAREARDAGLERRGRPQARGGPSC